MENSWPFRSVDGVWPACTWPLCDRVVTRDVEEVPLSRSLGTFRDDFSLALTFYVLTTVSCVRLCNDKVRTYLRIKALSQFYSLTAGSSWPPRTTLNSCVVFAKILDQRDDRVFYPNFLMDEFFYLLTPHFFPFCQFYAFLYFVHKISSMPTKNISLSRIVVMFWSKLLTSCSVRLTLKFLNLSLKIPWKHLEFSTEKIVRTLCITDSFPSIGWDHYFAFFLQSRIFAYEDVHNGFHIGQTS